MYEIHVHRRRSDRHFQYFLAGSDEAIRPEDPDAARYHHVRHGHEPHPGDFKNVFKQPKNVAIGTVLQFIIMPAAAFALIHLFALPPEIAIGVVLVGCCPGGTASNVISYIAKADVALSVSMTMVNTILAPFVTPFLVWLIAGAWVDIDFMSMMMSIVKMVLLPLLIGVGINYFFPRQVKKVNTIMPMFSALVVIITVGCVVSSPAAPSLTTAL